MDMKIFFGFMNFVISALLALIISVLIGYYTKRGLIELTQNWKASENLLYAVFTFCWFIFTLLFFILFE